MTRRYLILISITALALAVGVGLLAGGDYTLVGGFWAGGVARYNIYLPVVLRNVS